MFGVNCSVSKSKHASIATCVYACMHVRMYDCIHNIVGMYCMYVHEYEYIDVCICMHACMYL